MSNSLPRENLDCQPPFIQVLDVDRTASQSGNELNLSVVQKIVVTASKSGVGLLLNLEDYIASNDAGSLVTLSPKLDLGATLDTPIDVDVEDLAIDNGLLPHALLATVLIFEYLAFAIAVRADGLESLDHGSHLAHHRLHTMAIAAGTSSYGALFTTTAFALGTDDRALQG